MPAVIGVVFVFLVGVIIWVVSSSGDDDASPAGTNPGSAASSTAPTDPVVTETTAGGPDTTTEAPMPDPTTTETSTSTTTTTTTTAPPTTSAPPPTTAPGSPDGTIPGDLGISGQPMQQPGCDGAFITVLASAVGDQATPGGIANVLESYPGSSYLRTDQTCPSLTPDIDGKPIYVVYLGPFAVDTDACAARSRGPDGAYARRLSNDLGPDHSVACP